MAKRVHPIARVKLSAPGARWALKYDGFGQQELVGELMRQGRVAVSPVDFEALGLPAPGQAGVQVPSAMLLERGGLNCVVARPFLDTRQQIGLGHFTTYGGDWVSLPRHGFDGEMNLFQCRGVGNEVIGAVSKFTLPPNPVLAMSLYRTHPPDDFNWDQVAPYTEIHFGITEGEEWVLCLPYGAPLYLMRRVGGQWWKVPDTERSVRVPSLSGYGSGQRLLLWLAVWRGRLVLSTDGFAEDVWVYRAPEGPIRVKSGKWSLWHNAGQFMFSFLPVKMPAVRLDSAPVETGYETRRSTGQVFLTNRQQPVVSDRGAVLAAAAVADTTAVRPDLTATQRAWRAEIVPYVWRQTEVGTDPETGEPVSFETCVSPELYAVNVGQYAEVEEREAPAEEDLSAEVRRIEGSHSDQLPTVRYTLELDNQLGQRRELREYQRVAVELGWRLEDDTEVYTATAEGYTVEPPPEVRGGGEARLEVAMLDGLLRLRDEKADGRVPVFDGWPVVEVFRWVLDRCGIPRELQNLEDTSMRLSGGEPESPLWLPEPGRGWLEFLQEVARFDYGAALFVDAEGRFTKACVHCRARRTREDVAQHDGGLEGACDSEVRWVLATRGGAEPDPPCPPPDSPPASLAGEGGGEASPPCPSLPQGEGGGEVLAIVRPRLSLRERDYVNYVAVCGVGRDGRPVRSVVWDPASLYDPESDRYVGWRKMEVAALRGYTTQAETNRLAQELYAARSGRPEYVALLTPLEPEMRIGQVLEVQGAEQIGAGGQRYRIVALEHRVERSPRQVAATWVKGKWVGEASTSL